MPKSRFVFVAIFCVMLLVYGACFGRRFTFSLIQPKLRSPANEIDSVNQIYYVFSTSAQVLAGVLAVYVAVLFILAQLSSKPKYTRVVAGLYRSNSPIVIATVYVGAICFCIVLLARARGIVDRGDDLPLDLGLITVFGTLALLVPQIMSQVENTKTNEIAMKLASGVMLKDLRDYGLAIVDTDTSGQVIGIRLSKYNYRHNNYDPLGPVHELAMEAIGNQDRILFETVMRSLLRRMGRICGADVKATFGTGELQARVRHATRSARAPSAHAHVAQLKAVLHVLHYVVRRLRNLTKEWPGYGVLREHTIMYISDMLVALAQRKDSDQMVRLCILAIGHIGLAWKDTPNITDYEPARDLPLIVEMLDAMGDRSGAELLTSVIARFTVECVWIDMAELEIDNRSTSNTKDAIKHLADAMAPTDRVPWEDASDPWLYLLRRDQLPMTGPGIATAPSACAAPLEQEIVWAVPASGIFHRKGSRYYEITKGGRYMSLDEAERLNLRQAKAGAVQKR